MKIGILTYHSSHNYGAFLQAYALRASINDLLPDTRVEIINFSMKKSEKVNIECIKFNMGSLPALLYNIKRYFMFEKSLKKYQVLSGKKYSTDDLSEFSRWLNSQKYDAIIVGSDEVWKLDGYRGFPNPYWLPNIEAKYKISYAASSRTDNSHVTKTIRENISDLISDFCYIGLRDSVTKELIDSCSPTMNNLINCDPTFVYDFGYSKDEGRNFLQRKLRIHTSKKIIGLMVGVPELAQSIIAEYSDKFEFVSLYNYYEGTRGFRAVDPFDWIKCIAGLDGLITTFFHGMVFAIKYNTPFLTIENREISGVEYSKSYDLLSRNMLQKNFTVLDYTNHTEMKAVSSFLTKVDNESINNDFTKACNDEKTLFKSFEEKMMSLSK